jgi:hypothetical protein
VGYQSVQPGYKVRVDGLTLGQTHFLIQAALTYDDDLTAPERERLMPRAQMEILLAVFGEWERAVRLGARNVRISAVGDGQLDRFFRAWPHGVPPESVTSRPARPHLGRSAAASAPWQATRVPGI